MIRLEEAARELGVSKSTVSRAMSGKGRISEETRERVRSYIREHGGMEEKKKSCGQTQNIAVVIPSDAYLISIPFFQECLLGISEMASMLEYNVMIAIGSPTDASNIQALVEKKIVDGIILMRNVEGDSVLQYLVEQHFPTAMVGSCEYREVIQVDSDNRVASETLISLLIRQGYRHFAMVLGDSTYEVNKDRCHGFYDALEKSGLPAEHQKIYPNVTNVQMINSIISDIFAGKIECIVCGDDVLCTQMVSALQAEGYRIPKDVSIVSLCNSINLDCFSPAVTAINVSARKLGNVAGKQLIGYLKGETYNAKTTVEFEMMLRKSVGKIYQGQEERINRCI
ncbi:MAG: LacI family DNA-binding transcriptional regulator [Lachnospiraceae bacterium]|nr:LacI family DNA-binding transcriptional regulator [Lachnospiraceae bacterium]